MRPLAKKVTALAIAASLVLVACEADDDVEDDVATTRTTTQDLVTSTTEG